MNKALKSLKNIKISYFQLILFIELFKLLIFTIWNYKSCGFLWRSTLQATETSDFFMHIGYASVPWGTNIYEFANPSGLPCFPPLAYLLYGLLARIIGYTVDDPNGDFQEHIIGTEIITMYAIYTAVCIVLLIYAISLYQKKSGFLHRVIFPFILLGSFPFLFSIHQGNSSLLVAVLLSIALKWKDDNSKIKQEFAMLIIAVCAGLKIYPAIFGLMYIKEKRYKQAVRLVIYGIVLFFAPFALFGGIAAMRSLFSTLLDMSTWVNPNTVRGMAENMIRYCFGVKSTLVSCILQQLFLVASLLSFAKCKEKWGEVLLLCVVMVLYVSSNWAYSCIYTLPALLMFFYEKNDKPIISEKIDIRDIIVMALFISNYKITVDATFSTMANMDILYMGCILFDVIETHPKAGEQLNSFKLSIKEKIYSELRELAKNDKAAKNNKTETVIPADKLG